MRSVNIQDQFTPFGLWVREYCRDSKDGLCLSNLDYVFEDWKTKKLLLLEEKQSGGKLADGQARTFHVLDAMFRHTASDFGYEYWGFFVLQFAKGKTHPGPGMTLNGKEITCEQLVEHLNFKTKFCESLALKAPQSGPAKPVIALEPPKPEDEWDGFWPE